MALAADYRKKAAQCARLARGSADELVRERLLELQREFLVAAEAVEIDYPPAAMKCELRRAEGASDRDHGAPPTDHRQASERGHLLAAESRDDWL